AELLQKRWTQAVGGYQNAGKIAILGSKTTFQAIELSRKDQEWLATRLNRVEIIAGAWGMPLPLIRMQDATFSNVAGARSELWEGTLQPRLNRIARMLTLRVLPLITTEQLVARYDYTQVEALSENDLEAAQTAAEWSKTGAVIVDEVRTRLSLPPHPDKRIGQSQLVPTTIAVSSFEDIVAPPEPPAPPVVTPPDPAEPPKARKSIESRETVLAPIRDAYMRDLGSFFGAQRNAVLNAFGKATPEEEQFLERLIEIIGSKRFRDRLRRISQAPIEASVTLGATEAARALAVEVSFAIPTSEAALARVTSHLDLLGKGIENTTIADVQRVVTSQLQAGSTHEAMRTALGELFDGYEDWRVDRIARTETAAAYNLGGLGQYRTAGVELVTVVDGDADEVCASWNGREHVPLEEAEGAPLGHPNAVMAGTQIEALGAIEVGYRANWSGPLVSLTTARDAYLAIGPNHPVLTSRGWIAAKAIRKGDKVVRRARERFASDEHLHQPVARIENIFDALGSSGTHARIVAAPTYFHGDGNFCEGEVEIVRPDRPLLVDAVSPVPELVGEPLFVGADPVSALVSGDGSGMTASETVHLATASLVGLRDSRRVIGGPAAGDAALAEPLPDGAVANAEFVADLEHRTAIAVVLDEVVDVGRAEFGGHAFDLQTTSAAYFANDILVHNCTRSWIPEVGR
ncbi:MAG: phage portal protein, partial [Salinibacterium sp.]